MTCSLELCRTCMNEFSDKFPPIRLDSVESTFNPITVRQKLEAFAPELNLASGFSSVICKECAAAIDFIHKFKKKCLQTEELMQNYIGQFAEENNSEDSFLKTASVPPLYNEVDAGNNGLAQKAELSMNNHNIRHLDIPIHNQIPLQKDEEYHLELVNGTAVVFNDIEIEESNEEYTRTAEVSKNGYSDASNNIYQHNYTIFQTLYMTHNKRTDLYKCNHCPYNITCTSAISSHMKSHVKKKLRECKKCDFKSCLRTVLISHAFSHKQNQLCSCDFTTAVLSHVICNKKDNTCDKSFLCIECCYVAPDNTNIKSHLGSHLSSDCKKCKLLISKENT